MYLFFILPYRHIGYFRKTTNGYIISWWIGELLGWAELDLNQRRHIGNEFTVRPH